jgi:hypothetical protein
VADDIPPRSARRRSVIAEALTNAAKHARASTVSVQIEVAGDVLLLDVRDDGAGGGEFSRGTGLAGLKDRVEALGGRIFLAACAGRGPACAWNSRSPPPTPASLPPSVTGSSRSFRPQHWIRFLHHGLRDDGASRPKARARTPRRRARQDRVPAPGARPAADKAARMLDRYARI